ncbi:MAG: hypothetical protein KDA24_18485 [Deltaproteobacteria bacterium]|nr:hypothetical protein [Deltaproteobacteria bacterium]
MTYITRLIVPVLALGLALVAVPSEAEACSCGPVPPPKVALENADSAFVGTVTSISRVGDAGNPGGTLKVAFAIEHAYKGDKSRAVIETNASSAACGRAFEEGEKYLVYAEESDKVLRDSACSRTRLASAASEDFEAIGHPGVVVADVPDGTSIALSHVDPVTSQCDVQIGGVINAEAFSEAMGHAGVGAFVCATDLTVEGNVELAYAGTRLIALEYGGIRFMGNVLVSQPAVVLGAEVSGVTLVSERAAGSVFIGNSFRGAVITATDDILGLGSTCAEACTGPTGIIDLKTRIPVSATGIVQQVPRARIQEVPNTNPDGKFAGWIDTTPPTRPKYEDKPELKEIDLGDMTNEWPPPLVNLPGGSHDADVPWVAVYGDLLESDDGLGVFVPLHTGSFRRPGKGFVLVP